MQQEIWFQKYRILGLLGSGGTAKVYLAEHIKLNSYRAIKCISKNHPLYDLQRNEALILKNLKHSCIPIIYDIEEDEDGSYIVEQYLEGDTLKDYVASKGPIREDHLIHYGIQLCDLIGYLHSIPQPVLYLDLKPENIIVNGGSLKLVDFGSAVFRDQISTEECYAGTKGYAAPELYRQSRVDERCDVYGIGMLLYYMATGRAIKGDNCRIDNIDTVCSCSKPLKSIINHCLKFSPVSRYSTVMQLNKHLSAVLHKTSNTLEPSQSLQFAIAGAQPRVGVTHFAFMLCRYLRSRGYPCLYREYNKSGCVRSVKNCYESTEAKEGVYEILGIPMLPWDRLDAMDTERYPASVTDYGCITENNLPKFLEADVKLLVLGAKDWELQYSEQALNMVAEYKDVIYLFNYVNGKQFQIVMKNMEYGNSHRIPYEPDPFASTPHKNDSEQLFELILERGLQHRRQDYPRRSSFFRRLTIWGRKGSTIHET